MTKRAKGYAIGHPALVNSKGERAYPYVAWYAGGTRVPTFEQCKRKHSAGVPFWVNPYWLAQTDYLLNNSLLLLSTRAYDALKRCGDFAHEALPAKLFVHPKWSGLRPKPPWLRVPSVGRRKPLADGAVVVEVARYRVPGRRLTPLGKMLAEFDDDALDMPATLPPLFNVLGESEIYVSAAAKKTLAAEGIRIGYLESIGIPMG